MDKLEQKTILVTGEDAEIVSQYYTLTEAIKRRDDEKNLTLINPIVEYKTEEERAIFQRYREVVEKHRQANDLVLQPQLIPVLTQPVWQRPAYPVYQRPFFYECKHDKPTDLEMARILLHRRHLRVRNGSVYLYNGKFYRKLTEDQLKTLILEVLREELEVDGSSRQLASVAAAIVAEPTIEISEERIPKGGLCLKNCVMDIDSMACGNHSPEYFFTIQLQVDYQGPQPTPVMDQFIHQITGGDPVLAQRIWEMIGYCLVPQDNSAKRIVLYQGVGNTGKSVLGSLLASFYEESAVGSVDAFRIGDRFSLSALATKALNISMDLPNSALNDQSVGVLKQISGNDLVQVEEKYKTPYAARIGCKMVFGTNHQLRTSSFDAAFLRRILLIPFNYPVPRYAQDPHLVDKLKNERAGIFFKAMLAYRQLAANNYIFTGDDIFDLLNATQAGDQVIDQDALIEQFIECHVVSMPGGFVPTETLHVQFLSENPNGLSDRQKFSARFKQLAAKKGLVAVNKKKRINGEPTNGYEGIALV